MPSVSQNKGGFTLLEVIVALTIGALIVGVAHALIVSLGDAAASVTTATVRTDRMSNSERILKGLVGRLETGSDATAFEGLPDLARFKSWCPTPNGWLEACDVELSITAEKTDRRLEALLVAHGVRRRLVLATGFDSGAIRYLSDARLGGRWMTIWGAGISAPIAVGVMLDGDTVVLRVGDRG